ncbi:hypothetical protein KSC_022420 [Ktedonobacter sp. SOSP1-52]|nr:hypothetical protein KSC_022420 [Ktedonobacter sp. SOSP1-52]
MSPTRDAEAATRFFHKALHITADSAPQTHPIEEQATGPTVVTPPTTLPSRVINVDKNAAYPKVTAELKDIGALATSVEMRQVNYRNTLVEQDHRFIKRLVKPGMGFFSFETAWQTLQGDETMHMLRKGQVHSVGKGDIKKQVTFIARLFGVAV